MRGKKARAVRRAALPPDIRAAMKEKIGPLVERRIRKTTAANEVERAKVHAAREARKQAHVEAWAEFDNERAQIAAAHEALAEARLEGSPA